MLYYLFYTDLGDAVLESLDTRSVLYISSLFLKKNRITRSIYKILYNKNGRKWNYISVFALSDKFVREFWDKVNWRHISLYQQLSEDFIHEFRNSFLEIHFCPTKTVRGVRSRVLGQGQLV